MACCGGLPLFPNVFEEYEGSDGERLGDPWLPEAAIMGGRESLLEAEDATGDASG